MNVSHAEILARDIVSGLLMYRPGMFSLISIDTNELSKVVVVRGGFNHHDKNIVFTIPSVDVGSDADTVHVFIEENGRNFYFVNDGGIKSKDAVDIIIEAVKQED
jgi:hypothetical protein|nr:MAG TPA: hypothetical protein [Caudoviricetes sp.]